MPLEARVLLGWMQREQAIKFLTEDCVFESPFASIRAEELWSEYRSRVLALEERDALAPERLRIDGYHEIEAIKEFKQHYKAAPNILDVIRVDPMRLVVHQLFIVTERSSSYISKVSSLRGWLDNAILCKSAKTPDLSINCRTNAIDVKIPDAEYVLAFNPKKGFQIERLARHVNVTAFDERLMLWAGYHQSYARILSMAPDAIDRSLVVVLTTDGAFKLSPHSPNQGEREMLTGARPPFFGDFFDERFFMPVKLRKRRYELQIRANIAAIDEDS